ncbi:MULTISPECIES: hypothetical protein [unclassified Coleofasciculus]|uniref:hypothetical protein n=1 Tax=unclassified Coleofasciculus TaxID=2692782 RepID=UPI001882C539|nr:MULTISPECIES: hypothetical protein [unclassified Coleofasciculus]MBE9125631.1 hypothetical protein [Coleofasciculus sp. LEGE 07081]MBE9148785.1 hypothetical protein [Coleofasciculus sp. LEGE 07092]
MPPQSARPEADTSNALWYLGIDFGTTGVSAVLLNQVTGQQYPIYWQNNLQRVNDSFAKPRFGETLFRLPAITYSGLGVKRLFVEPPGASVAIGSLASLLAKEPGIYLQNFKPYLQVGIPYYCPQRHEWEPTLQLPGQQLVSLYWVRWSIQAILATLTPESTLPDVAIAVAGVGLDSETLGSALGQLAGVILNCPVDGSDTYQLNLREAVIAAKLVPEIKQIVFVEDAIATILAGLPRFKGQDTGRIENPETGNRPSPWYPQRGSTLAINAGATTTELGVVNLPHNLQGLTYNNFTLHGWSYGGQAIDQDIFWQLLYPQLSETQRQKLSLEPDLEVPEPGHSDELKRNRAAFLLQSSDFGEALLKACGYLKLILQHKEEFTLELGRDRWTVKRRDLETKVIFPFLEQLNQQLNTLLAKAGLLAQGIVQLVCRGGSMTFPQVQHWLQQKFPNAIFIETVDLPEECWVAAGLATVPLYPQVLNYHQQQYSDYFLLLELLRAFTNSGVEFSLHTYSIGDILQRLERRGLNTSPCYERLVRLLEGHLPPGLIPTVEYGSLLSHASQENLHYSRIAAAELFSIEGGRLRPNRQQHEYLNEYMELVLSSIYQTFEEPLIVNFSPSSF